MKKIFVIGLAMMTFSATAQEEGVFTLDPEVIQAAQAWARENLDDEALSVLHGGDQEKIKQFFEEVQKKLHGEYVIDLAQIRDLAKVVLPILEEHEDTQPYAIWLKTRFDYLEVAEEFRVRIPPPKIEPGATLSPPQNPRPEIGREIWIKKYVDRPVPAKAAPYVKRLKPLFTKHNAPAELVWIAEVESSFDPRARSPAGAAGLFQLMPATAKQYGLKTWPLDQRYQPEESAGAAAKHLAYLHRRFKDWRLAIAAYNAGEGTVQRALDRNKAKTFDEIARKLPSETQMYVPKVEATLLRREGIKLGSLKP
jgi:membrane-bound lytic murein transglycosylase D